MNAVIDKYHESFHNAIQIFGGIVHRVNDSVSKTHKIDHIIASIKSKLSVDISDLQLQRRKHEELKEIVVILSKIDEMTSLLDTITIHMSKRRYEKAIVLLVDTLTLLDTKEYVSIAALEDIKSNLQTKKDIIHGKLIDELHNYLYLRDENAQNRLSAFSLILQDTSSFPSLKKDLNLNIHVFLNSLKILSKLPEALRAIQNRLLSECCILVETTVDEIREMSTYHSLIISNTTLYTFHQQDEEFSFLSKLTLPHSASSILTKCLDALYHRFCLILTSHKVVIDWVVDNDDTGSALMHIPYRLSDIWQVMQGKIIQFIAIHVDGSILLSSKLSSDSQETQTLEQQFLMQRMYSKVSETKRYFSFRWTKPNKQISELVRSISDHDSSQSELSLTHSQDEYSIQQDPTALNYKPLSIAGPEQVLIIYSTIRLWQDRMKILFSDLDFKQTLQYFDMFIHQVIFNLYLPILDAATFQALDFILDDDYMDVTTTLLIDDAKRVPILKSTQYIIYLLTRLMGVILYIPKCKKHVEKLCISILAKYLQYYQQLYKNIFVTDSELLSVLLSRTNDMKKLAIDIKDMKDSQKLLEQEALTILKWIQNRSIHKSEILTDYRKWTGCAHIVSSLSWLLSWCNVNIREHGYDKAEKESITEVYVIDTISIHYIGNELTVIFKQLDQSIRKMPLSVTFEKEYTLFCKSFLSIHDMILDTLRIELRCHAIYYIDYALREGNYQTEGDNEQPDSFILRFNQDLYRLDSILTKNMNEKQVNIVTYGLYVIIELVLVYNCRYIKVSNAGGPRLLTNIAALQQNLFGLYSEVHGKLYAAMEFYRIFLMDWAEMIQHIKLNKKIISKFFYPDLWLELFKSKLLSREKISEAYNLLFSE